HTEIGIIFPIVNDVISQALRHAVLRLLRPLVRILLRHGMAYGTFAELARKAYVDEAFEHMQTAGLRATVSGVSALTGLTRKETRRLADLDVASGSDTEQRYNRAIRVVSGWLADARFLDPNGEPAVLALEGEHSFATLVHDYSGDVPPTAMLKILQGSQTVAPDASGVRLLERAYLPTSTPVNRIDILGRDTAELLYSIGHNIATSDEQRALRVFQRKVSNPAVRAEAVPAFREFSNRKSQELLETYHRWLSAHEIEADNPEGATPHYIAVGIHYYDDTLIAQTPTKEPTS
ncbi:MAG: DUF6502 family protein, partial [Lamprobacter sp.]|uniref:DUF6502 family protein n=1 Tax=Lamprobacter sp. TaxID=3100796 RepID=UPI002B25AEF2